MSPSVTTGECTNMPQPQRDEIAPTCVDIRIRLTGSAFAAIENWRRSQNRIPCRSKAIIQLVQQALDAGVGSAVGRIAKTEEESAS
jgi:hypothetical protein